MYFSKAISIFTLVAVAAAIPLMEREAAPNRLVLKRVDATTDATDGTAVADYSPAYFYYVVDGVDGPYDR